MKLLSLSTRRRIRESSSADVVDVLNADERAVEMPYWIGPSPRIHLSAESLVMQGACRYGPDHPFVRTLNEGADALARFYDTFAPRTLVEMYALKREGSAGENLPPWELPWLLRARAAPPGEHGLSPDHGVSYYGPCSEKKIALEHRRLCSLVSHIRTDGYRPNRHGDIQGYFLQRGAEWRFFVRGGKHRAAVLVHLGWTRIPVRMKDGWPRVIHRENAGHWPLVRDGSVARTLAEAIFDKYFE